MRPLSFLLLLLSSLTTPLLAQSETAAAASTDRWSLSAEGGGGWLIANSNLSPQGAHYRDRMDGGAVGNFKASYRLDDWWQVGVKYGYMAASGDYTLKEGMQVADDASLHYVAPQIGIRKRLSSAVDMEYMLGAGYMYYRCKELLDAEERDYKKGFWGANLDIVFSYRLSAHYRLGVGASLTKGSTGSLKECAGGAERTVKLDDWNRIRVVRTDLFLSLRAVW